MSLVHALIDEENLHKFSKFHFEVREVVKEFEDEIFHAIGKIKLEDIEYMGHGDSGYIGYLRDRIDKKMKMKIFLSDEEFNTIEDDLADDKEIELCVWGRKETRKLFSHRTKKGERIYVNENFYIISMCKPAKFMNKFDVL